MTQKSTVLIVDDDPSARDTLEALLFPEGYDLDLAASGQEALARLDELAPDVILLDVMMPGMDGFEVCQRIKTDERWQHIPVILVTALDSTGDLVRGFDAGADDFLTKPVNSLELQARVRSMLRIKRQYDELEATLRLREDLSNMLVHDMRNPLTTILLFGMVLRSSLTTPENLEQVERILKDARRLESFINDLLVMAKTQEHELILNRSMVDANELALAAERGHRGLARSMRINLVVDLPEESRQVSLDSNLFRRVLDNLLSNALKFSPPESTVTLCVEYPEGPQVRVSVLDQGPGIPEEYRDRIFDQFEIVKLKREAGVSQVGLGLAFCKLVVEAHGGRISVDSNANEPVGAVFAVEI